LINMWRLQQIFNRDRTHQQNCSYT